jgi:hypothetical protein
VDVGGLRGLNRTSLMGFEQNLLIGCYSFVRASRNDVFKIVLR